MTPADLRNARSLFGWSQRRLADEIGVAKDTLSRWERGKQPVDHPKMLSLALYALAEMHNVRSPPPDDWEAPEF